MLNIIQIKLYIKKVNALSSGVHKILEVHNTVEF